MGLLLLIGLARIVLYCRTLWDAFKALKISKRRRKIPRPDLNPQPIQTAPSSDPLSASQKARRTRIRQLTKLCLVWVIWSHSKRFLDWVSWVIPFYDELNLGFLIWLIIQGPSAADTVFKHLINRIATPYEQTFDSILGTTHDMLQVTMYLITSAPSSLNRKWESWKARQFNKSLLSTRPSSPPIRVSVSKPYQPNLHLSRPEIPTLRPSDTSRVPSNVPPSNITSSVYLSVPERKPTLSRKLSAGYKRAVSNSRPKAILADPAPYHLRSVSANRSGNLPSSGLGPTFSTSSSSTSISYTNFPLGPASAFSISSQANMLSLNPDPDAATKDQEEDDNSIIIRDRSFTSTQENNAMSIHGAALNPINPQHHPPPRTVGKKRVRDPADVDAVALRKAKKALRSSTTMRSNRVTTSKNKLHPPTGKTKSTENRPTGTLTRTCPAQDSSSVPASREPQEKHETWQPSSNAALPPPDPTISPSKVAAPVVRRRLHNDDEPLPLPNSVPPPDVVLPAHDSSNLQDLDTRERILVSVRSLESSADLPSLDRSTGRLTSRLPSSAMSSNPTLKVEPLYGSNATNPKADTPSKTKRIAHHSNISERRKKASPAVLKRRREISGKLGQEREASLAAKKFELVRKQPSLPPRLASPTSDSSSNCHKDSNSSSNLNHYLPSPTSSD